MTKIRKMFNNKIFWMVLSFLIAFSLWFYVNGFYNPQDTKDFSSIPVTVTFDGSIPQQNNLAILKTENLTVDVKLEGSRVALANLSRDEISARVDLSSVTVAGDYDLPITVILPGTNLLISNQSVSSIKMSFDKLDRKQVEAKVVTNGQVKDGYWLGEITASPGSMKVEGPASLLAKVENYLIEVDVTGLSSVKTQRQNVVYVDASGHVVDGQYLTGEFSSVSVNIPVYYIKEVPLVVTGLNKSGGTDNTMFHYTVKPSTVRIAGPVSELELLNQIEVDTVDTSRIEYREHYTRSLTVPTGMKLLDDVETVEITVSMEDSVIRRLALREFSLENVPAGVTAEVQDKTLAVRLRGLSDDIMSISASDIRAVVDMSSFTDAVGSVSVPVTFTVPDGKNVGVVGKYTVTVTIH